MNTYILNSISPLPFYNSRRYQNHRKSYAFGHIYPLIMYREFLMPFQFVVSKDFAYDSIELINLESGNMIPIKTELIENGLTRKEYEGYDIIYYPAFSSTAKRDIGIPSISEKGRYYITFENHTFPPEPEEPSLRGDINANFLHVAVSEIFTCVGNVREYIYLEYSNESDLVMPTGKVHFLDDTDASASPMPMRCYLCSEIGKPEYVFEEEVIKRMGYSFVESALSKKIYKFSFIAPEFLCDALRIVKLCSHKTIFFNGITYNLTSFNMIPKWEEQGDLASVECEFETDTVISYLGGVKQ